MRKVSTKISFVNFTALNFLGKFNPPHSVKISLGPILQVKKIVLMSSGSMAEKPRGSLF